MFTRLRNQFLLLNLSVTSGVIILALGLVYFIMYGNLQAEIRARLQAHPQAQMRVESVADRADRTAEADGDPSAVWSAAAADGAGTFHVEVDESGEIVRIESAVPLPESSYRRLAAIAWNNRDVDRVIRSDGREWRYSVSPIRVRIVGQDGEPLAVEQHNYSILFLDVTEMNQALARLLTTLVLVGIGTLVVISAASLHFANRAIRPIRDAWEKQKQFVADASHELKTPLSVIRANCDALAANPDDAIRNQMKWIEYIRGGADRMAKLVHELLILAGTDDERLQFRRVRFHVSGMVEEVARSMEAAAAGKGLTVTRSIEPELLAVGDPDGIRQAVEILFDNAVKYADPGGWITVSLARMGRRIVFSIANSGPGIAREDLPRVFDRFFRADRSRTHQDGSFGLGLPIAQSIVRRHGSEISVRSEEHVSTTFSFALAAGGSGAGRS